MSLTQKLGYAGLLPFIGFAALGYLEGDWALSSFIVYSALILSFMAGGSWGALQAHLKTPVAGMQWKLAAAILIFLWGWGMTYVPVVPGLAGLLVGFVLLLGLEQTAIFRQHYTAGYRVLRLVLTTVVVACHAVLLWKLTLA